MKASKFLGRGLFLVFLLLISFTISGCAISGMKKSKVSDYHLVTKNNPMTQPPSKWLGAVPHFVMMGKSGQYKFDIQILEKSPHLKSLIGKREYEKLVSTGEVRFVEFEAGLKAVIGGIEREIELGFSNADFDDEKVPGIFSLIPNENEDFMPIGIKGAKAGCEIEWEWEIPSKNIFVAQELKTPSGLFFFDLNAGTLNKDKTLDNGYIGGFGIAELENGTIYISFTVPMVEEEEDFDETQKFYE